MFLLLLKYSAEQFHGKLSVAFVKFIVICYSILIFPFSNLFTFHVIDHYVQEGNIAKDFRYFVTAEKSEWW